MKKLLVIALILSLLLCAMSALAELGSADVAMNGNQYHISLESVEIKDGKLYVALNGMAQTMAFGSEGIQLAADIVPVYGEERLHATDKDILFGADVTYRFDRDTLPDAILMIPTQDAENPITLWENPDAEPAIPDSPDEGTTIPDALVGHWQGTGTPKNGGPSIDLTATINADGTGEYTFIQDDYTESYPFTISSDDSAFSVDIPADNTLGIARCEGTWVLEDGVLKLDITTTFANGGSYSYTAECERADAAAAVPDWAGREWQLDTIHFKTLSKDSPYSIDGGLSLNGGSTYGNRLVLADGAVDTDIDLNGLIQAVPQLPFSVPELELTGYDGYTLDGDTLRLEPGDIEMTVGHEDDALSLTYVTHVDIQSQSMGDGLTSQAGETDLEVILGFVPMEAAPAEDSVEETAETPAEEPVDEPAEEPEAPTEDPEEPVEAPAEELSSIEVGDTVTFGHYEQDGDDASGPEPIEWLALEANSTTATLISVHALDIQPFNDSSVDISYDSMRFDTSLYRWLNQAFADSAFSPQQREYLSPVDGQSVMLLSREEALTFFPDDMSRIAAPAAGISEGDSEACGWWLGTPGDYPTRAMFVRADGSIDSDGLSLTIDEGIRPVIRLDLAKAFTHAEPGTPVRLGGADYELQLFTMAQDNWDLVSGSARDPLPAQGEVYLLRFAVAEGSDAVTPDTIKETIAPAMGLYAEDEGVASELFRIVTPDDGETRVFDILFYCEDFHALEDLSLLCDGVLYPLDGLPRDGEKLALPTPEELAIEALNALHARAKNEAGDAIENAVCTGNVIVAWYTDSNDGASPRVITAGSINEWDFPMEYRAESYDTARWAAIIHPTYRQVGWYSGLAGGAANETTTWLSLFDLETDKLYEVKVATEDPPQTITVQTINGIPVHSGASGDFRGDDALARLTQLIEAARTAPTPSPTPEPMPTPTPTPTPTPEPTPEPTVEPTEDLPDVKSLLDAGAQDAANKLRMGSTGLNERIGVGVNAAENAKPTVDGISDADMTDAILDALSEEVYRTTYDALLSGEVVQKGSKGNAARGVQQTLVAFGQSISVDGNVGPKSIAALNAVQAAFGLPETESLDAEGYATLLPRLLMVTNPDKADALLAGHMDSGAYDYMRACALVAQGKYASAKTLFEASGWGDWESRAGACVQKWPKTGVLYKNPSVKGSSTELAVQFNTDPDTAMLVKIYTADGVLARTMFIGGTGKAKTSLPAGTYIIKDGTGKNWYGEEEAFGSEGYYEIMTFGNGQQEVQLKKNYSSTITVNVQENNPDAEGVGSDWESWSDF